jgi:DNA-binding NtrC family response regulator
MNHNLYSILVVGPNELFPGVIDHLKAKEDYDLRYAFDLEFARALLREHAPAVIVLALPDDQEMIRKAVGWIGTVKNLAPVLVLSRVADTDLYMTAMESGAFDFLTPTTPPEGIDWILSNALLRGDPVAA